ncbi:MAG: hypothetical protein M3R59_08800, partial [Verrucomicrobiota bacterium]|nr:hypothetical protein [Verrucomicrobiota bacterium]
MLLSASPALAQWPLADGTTWRYALTREPSSAALTFTRTIHRQKDDVELESSTDGSTATTEVLREGNGDVQLIAEINATGKRTAVEPPAIFLPAKLAAGTTWNFRGEIAGFAIALPQTIVREEEVTVPAGTYKALYVRGEKSGTFQTRTERWFVRDVGWVKEILTQRSPTGELVTRNTLELLTAPSSDSALTAPAKTIEASVSTSTGGKPLSVISADALQIVARWRVLQVPPKTRIRAIWIADDIGDVAPPNYKIDEAEAVTETPDAVGTFTLSRPDDGWAPGKYRVEFYVNMKLAETIKLKIQQPPSTPTPS